MLPVVPMLYITSLGLVYFITESLYLPEVTYLWPLSTTNLFSNALLFPNLNSVTFSSSYIIILCLSLEKYCI